MEHKYTNRLIHEKSPYLLQHAHNPVDWYPWGEEAFKKARDEDKPIFLSIGYSTCHWCHVMERESFEKEDVAQVLNRDFVAIKVDREERPDLDHVYMAVCQLLTGSGGWPLTIFMTPDKKPFYAGTYFPHSDRVGAPGLLRILNTIAAAWKHERQKLLQSADAILEEVQAEQRLGQNGKLSRDTLDKAFKMYLKIFDPVYGGFGQAPKFPSPHNLTFLLRYGVLTGQQDAIDMAERTLEAMYRGGIYDHIGFGFARYATDSRWLVPHFEKMLYDNALLAIAYLEAYQATGKEFYSGVAREIFTYVLRDMTSPEGGFYSAQDADSEGEEGRFYLWTPREVTEVLGQAAADRFCSVYDITAQGNFEGANIPNLIKAGKTGLTEKAALDGARQRLFLYRERRVHPFKDDKVLTAWNGLMIAALGRGYLVLGQAEYRDAGVRAAEFILSHLRRSDGRLLARYRDGEAAYPAYIDDYAFLAWGLLELHQATQETRWLELAAQLTRAMIELFWDAQEGGFFYTGHDAQEQIVRTKEVYDLATPSGNSVAAVNLIRLARLTGNSDWEELAGQITRAFSSMINAYPLGYSHLLLALMFEVLPSREVVLVGNREDSELDTMWRTVREQGYPQTNLVLYSPPDPVLEKVAPYLASYQAPGGRAAAFICTGMTCQQPVTSPRELAEALTQPGTQGIRA